MGSDGTTRNLMIKVTMDGDQVINARLATTADLGSKAAGHGQAFGDNWKLGYLTASQMAHDFIDIAEKAWAIGERLVKQAEQHEEAQTTLRNSFKATGQEIENNTKLVNDWSQKMQQTAGQDADQLRAGLGRVNEVLKVNGERLTEVGQAAIGYAEIQHTSVESALTAVRNGIDGNNKIFKALGITVDAHATKEERLALLMHGTAAGFAAAEEKANSFAGESDRLKLALGDIEATVGGLIGSAADGKSGALSILAGVLENINTQLEAWISKNQALVAQLRGDLVGAVFDVAKGALLGLAYIAQVGQAIDQIQNNFNDPQDLGSSHLSPLQNGFNNFSGWMQHYGLSAPPPISGEPSDYGVSKGEPGLFGLSEDNPLLGALDELDKLRGPAVDAARRGGGAGTPPGVITNHGQFDEGYVSPALAGAAHPYDFKMFQDQLAYIRSKNRSLLMPADAGKPEAADDDPIRLYDERFFDSGSTLQWGRAQRIQRLLAKGAVGGLLSARSRIFNKGFNGDFQYTADGQSDELTDAYNALGGFHFPALGEKVGWQSKLGHAFNAQALAQIAGSDDYLQSALQLAGGAVGGPLGGFLGGGVARTLHGLEKDIFGGGGSKPQVVAGKLQVHDEEVAAQLRSMSDQLAAVSVGLVNRAGGFGTDSAFHDIDLDNRRAGLHPEDLRRVA